MKKKIKVAFIYKPCKTLTKENFFTLSYNFFINALKRNNDIDVTYFPCENSFDTTKLRGKYDLILLFENGNHCTPDELLYIKKVGIPVIVKVGDLHASNLFNPEEFHEKYNISAYFGYQNIKNFHDYYPSHYLYETVIFGLEPKLFSNLTPFSIRIKEKILNSGATGNTKFISRFYNKIKNPDNALRHYKLRTMCNTLPYVDYTSTLNHEFIGDKYSLLLQKYRTAIAATTTNYTAKYLEIPAAGCMSFMEVNDQNKAKTLGFIDGKNAIFINEKTYKKKFEEYLDSIDDPKWELIAKSGHDYVMENLTNDNAVKSLVKLFNKLL